MARKEITLSAEPPSSKTPPIEVNWDFQCTLQEAVAAWPVPPQTRG